MGGHRHQLSIPEQVVVDGGSSGLAIPGIVRIGIHFHFEDDFAAFGVGDLLSELGDLVGRLLFGVDRLFLDQVFFEYEIGLFFGHVGLGVEFGQTGIDVG